MATIVTTETMGEGQGRAREGLHKIGKKYLHLELCDKLIYVVIYYYNLNWNFSFDPLVQ